jgi:hemoglobin
VTPEKCGIDKFASSSIDATRGADYRNPMDPISQLCSAVSEEKIRAMVTAFYRRVKQDDLIGQMYPPNDWEGAEKRLADFIVYRFGGPPTYIEERGHPRLRMRHFPFAIGLAERDRWLTLMGEAMKETEIPAEQAPLIGEFFAMVADSMRNREG